MPTPSAASSAWKALRAAVTSSPVGAWPLARRALARRVEGEQGVRVRVLEQPALARLGHQRLPAERGAAEQRAQRRLRRRPALGQVGLQGRRRGRRIHAGDERAGDVERRDGGTTIGERRMRARRGSGIGRGGHRGGADVQEGDQPHAAGRPTAGAAAGRRRRRAVSARCAAAPRARCRG
jgi:hypothetical protein